MMYINIYKLKYLIPRNCVEKKMIIFQCRKFKIMIVMWMPSKMQGIHVTDGKFISNSPYDPGNRVYLYKFS